MNPGTNDPVPTCPVRGIAITSETAAVPLGTLAVNMREHGASCQPVSPSRETPTSASSVTQLSPHVPKYVLIWFRFHWFIISWFIINDLSLPPSE